MPFKKGQVGWNKGLTGKTNSSVARQGGFYDRSGPKNHKWLSDEDIVKNKRSLHKRVIFMYGPANHCENPECSGLNKRYDWSNIEHDYKSFARSDWQQLCKTCHARFDKEHHGITRGRKKNKETV